MEFVVAASTAQDTAPSTQHGGLTDRAASKILVRRAQDPEGPEVTVDYKRLLAGKDRDLELAEGDVVVVKESFF